MADKAPLYTVREAAALTGWHPRSLNRLLKQGQLDAFRVGWQYLFSESQIEALVPDLRGSAAMPIDDTFWQHVRITPTCWLWTASTAFGYGQVTRRGKRYKAHRLAYEWVRGPIPSGLDLDHLCRVRNCVNPAHLEAVTRRENLLRGKGLTARYANRTHCDNGHPFSGTNLGRKGGYQSCRACDNEAHAKRKRGSSK